MSKMNAFETGFGGFWLTFPNGWTVSVQIRRIHHCDNKREDPNTSECSSNTAEVWAFTENDKYYPKEPKGYQTMDEVLSFIDEVRKKESSK